MEDHNHFSISDWVEKIMLPIEESVVGIDLSRDAKFFQIKSEINKIENMKAGNVKTICIQLLCDKSKDLRLLVYLIFSCLIKYDSLEEWHLALSVLMSCLLKYKSELYPKKPAAKMAALLWLNQERIKLIFIDRIRRISNEKLVEYQQSVSNLNRWLAENSVFSVEKVSLGFEQWLKYHIENHSISAKKVSTVEEVRSIEKSELTKVSMPIYLFDKTIKNMNEVESATMLIVNYCELHGRAIQAAAYRRALRWSALMPKVDEFGVTALSQFSEKNSLLLTQCQEEYINAPKECYKKCEELFLLPGGQIKLDIQYYAIKSAQIFNSELAKFIKEALCSFVNRFPGAEKWRYNNEESCTSAMVQGWIKEMTIVSNNVDLKNSNDKSIKINDKYQQVLEEKELLLLRKICGISQLDKI